MQRVHLLPLYQLAWRKQVSSAENTLAVITPTPQARGVGVTLMFFFALK